MHFCKNCKNMYYIKLSEEEPHNLIYYCRNCGTEDNDLGKNNIHVSKTLISEKDENFSNVINKYTKFDPTLPRVNNVPCPNKKCLSHTDKKVQNEIILIRYNDSKLDYVYLCSHCDTAWKM